MLEYTKPFGKILGREEILAAQDLETETIAVPEWRGSVILKGGNGDERDAFEGSIMTGKGKDRDVNTKRLRTKLLAWSIVDEAGNRQFSEADLDLLSKKNAKVIERLFKVAQKLWGLDAKDVEDLVGNLPAGPSAGTGTDSPKNGASPHLVTPSAS